jgi:hypothetical protein
MGLLMDVSDSMLLGQHALGLRDGGLRRAGAARSHPHLPLPEQTLHVMGLTLAASGLMLLLNMALGAEFPGPSFFISPVIAAMLWAPGELDPLPVVGAPPPRRRDAVSEERRRDARPGTARPAARAHHLPQPAAAGRASGILIAFAILLGRFTWLQVVQRQYYHTLASRTASRWCRWSRTAAHPRPQRRGARRQLFRLHAGGHAQPRAQRGARHRRARRDRSR